MKQACESVSSNRDLVGDLAIASAQYRRSRLTRSLRDFAVSSLFVFLLTDAAAAFDLTPRFEPLDEPCLGRCSATVFVGRRIDTAMSSMFGTQGHFTAPWNYKWGDSEFLGGAVSRRLVRFGDAFDIEAEAGVGQRFRSLHESEAWVALYGRWRAFPWNDRLRTTVAISTGLNYASAVPRYEEIRTQVKGGSHLMHYLSPEITFGLPDQPNWDLVFRLHHRSGGREYWGPVGIFNGTGGGVQYGEIGLRYRF